MQPAPARRESLAEWLRLAKPIAARLGKDAVLVLDLGRTGAFVSGRCRYEPGTVHEFAFAEAGVRVNVRCVITAVADHLLTRDVDLIVRFLHWSDPLADFITRYEDQIRSAEAANAEGNIARNVIDGDHSLADLGSAARSTGTFLRCRFRAGKWSREVTATRDQPTDGFTIFASETEDQIQLLQLAYEESNEQGRQLMREFAAATLAPER